MSFDLKKLREAFGTLGEDLPDLDILLFAAEASLRDEQINENEWRTRGDDETVDVPVWVLRELVRNLERYRVEEGLIELEKLSPATRERLEAALLMPRVTPTGRKRRVEELPPLARAKALSVHRKRWAEVVRLRAQGLSRADACASVGADTDMNGGTHVSMDTVDSSYRLIEAIRTRRRFVPKSQKKK